MGQTIPSALGAHQIDNVQQLIGIELPAGGFELLKEEDKKPIKTRYEKSKGDKPLEKRY